MKVVFFLILSAQLALTACTSAAERAERDRAAVARRITEICSLPPAERKAAIEKLEKESGLVVVCGGS